jgi:hypothetical protein
MTSLCDRDIVLSSVLAEEQSLFTIEQACQVETACRARLFLVSSPFSFPVFFSSLFFVPLFFCSNWQRRESLDICQVT